MLPIEFLVGIVVGMLAMLVLLTLIAFIQFTIGWTGTRTVFPRGSELIDGIVDDE